MKNENPARNGGVFMFLGWWYDRKKKLAPLAYKPLVRALGKGTGSKERIHSLFQT